MAPLVRTPTQRRWEQYLEQYGKRSRSAASNMWPHLNLGNNPRAANPTARGSAAAHLYPHLPQSASARANQPKPRVRSRARRIYGDLE